MNEGRVEAAEKMLGERVDETGEPYTPAMLRLIRELKEIISKQNERIDELEARLERKKKYPEPQNKEYFLAQVLFKMEMIPKTDQDALFLKCLMLLGWELRRVKDFDMEVDNYAINTAWRHYKDSRAFTFTNQLVWNDWDNLLSASGGQMY